MVFHQFGQPLAKPGTAQIIGAHPLMADYTVSIHVLRIIDAKVPDIVKERGQHHFIVITFIQRKLRGLGHMLDL